MAHGQDLIIWLGISEADAMECFQFFHQALGSPMGQECLVWNRRLRFPSVELAESGEPAMSSEPASLLAAEVVSLVEEQPSSGTAAVSFELRQILLEVSSKEKGTLGSVKAPGTLVLRIWPFKRVADRHSGEGEHDSASEDVLELTSKEGYTRRSNMFGLGQAERANIEVVGWDSCVDLSELFSCKASDAEYYVKVACLELLRLFPRSPVQMSNQVFYGMDARLNGN